MATPRCNDNKDREA